MAQKPTTGSKSTSSGSSNSSSFKEVFDDEKDGWRSNSSRPADPSRSSSGHSRLESEMPPLDDNDVWYYQLQLERFIERAAPGMCGRYLGMLAAVCAQARRANKDGA